MWLKAFAAAAVSVLGVASAHAQVIYEPVQSQYQAGDRTFYYGGNNPRAIEYARRQLTCFQPGSGSQIGTYGGGYIRRGLIGEASQYTVSDCAPYRNAIVYGYTSVDARNDAYANVPRFFRMADLQGSAVPSADGLGVVVPAQPRSVGTIDIRPARSAAPSTRPAETQPRPVLIIPKGLLEAKPATGPIVSAQVK
jgi:hypothetical protein